MIITSPPRPLPSAALRAALLQDTESWAALSSLEVCWIWSYFSATHTCAYTCFLSQFAAGEAADLTSCWLAERPAGAAGTTCADWPTNYPGMAAAA